MGEKETHVEEGMIPRNTEFGSFPTSAISALLFSVAIFSPKDRVCLLKVSCRYNL